VSETGCESTSCVSFTISELYSCLEEEARRRQASKAEFIRELLSQACKGGGSA